MFGTEKTGNRDSNHIICTDDNSYLNIMLNCHVIIQVEKS